MGFSLPETDGPTIWLPVRDEYVVTNKLSSRGIVVHPGSYFTPKALESDHVLINGSALAEGQKRVAEILRAVAGLG